MITRIFIASIILTSILPLTAIGAKLDPAPEDRPSVGLALSGGGARGAAHVGVLKALESLDIPIDYIAGTSMGAIIGGLYAAGYNAAQIEQILLENRLGTGVFRPAKAKVPDHAKERTGSPVSDSASRGIQLTDRFNCHWAWSRVSNWINSTKNCCSPWLG